MDQTTWLFAGFGVFVLGMLFLDLRVFHRQAHAVGLREATIWFSVWVALALLFALGVFLWLGSDKGVEFLTAYAIEKTLSADNVFVFLAIFSDFAVPDQYRHRALFYGILGALVMRAVFIATGVTLLNMFHWVIYPLGAFLIFTALRFALRRNREFQREKNPVLKLAQRFLPVTEDYDGQRFFVYRSGVLMATPLFLVVLVIEVNDVAFALDSVPAVLSITNDPFIVYTSNVFAILGLRALFFLISGALQRLRYLGIGLAFVLGFVGIKMLVSGHYEIPTVQSLAVVLIILTATILVSWLKGSGNPNPNSGPDSSRLES